MHVIMKALITVMQWRGRARLKSAVCFIYSPSEQFAFVDTNVRFGSCVLIDFEFSFSYNFVFPILSWLRFPMITQSNFHWNCYWKLTVSDRTKKLLLSNCLLFAFFVFLSFFIFFFSIILYKSNVWDECTIDIAITFSPGVLSDANGKCGRFVCNKFFNRDLFVLEEVRRSTVILLSNCQQSAVIFNNTNIQGRFLMLGRRVVRSHGASHSAWRCTQSPPWSVISKNIVITEKKIF